MDLRRWVPEADGPLSEWALKRKLERLGYRVTHYVYSPGTCFEDHTHTADKMDAVVSGRFRMTIEAQAVILEAGDMVAVPRGVVHSAEVVGERPVVSLDGGLVNRCVNGIRRRPPWA
jgi:quercetin dioxygenase-like cupin family protein